MSLLILTKTHKGISTNDFKESFLFKKMGGVSKSMLKQSRLNFDKIEKCE